MQYVIDTINTSAVCIPWVARLCLTVVSCWKCLCRLTTPGAFTCARTRKESISCRSTGSTEDLFPPKLQVDRSESSINALNMMIVMVVVMMMMMMMMIIIIIIIIIVVIVVIIIVIIATVLDLLRFQRMKEGMKEGRRGCNIKWIAY